MRVLVSLLTDPARAGGRQAGPGIIAETRGYIRDFEAGVAATSTALDLYRYMSERYPRRINRGALWGSARAAKE